MHKIVQTLNLEEDERTEKVIVVLLGNGAQEKEIKDYLWFVSIEIAQPHDIEVGEKRRWKNDDNNFKRKKLISDRYHYSCRSLQLDEQRDD